MRDYGYIYLEDFWKGQNNYLQISKRITYIRDNFVNYFRRGTPHDIHNDMY